MNPELMNAACFSKRGVPPAVTENLYPVCKLGTVTAGSNLIRYL